MMSDNDNNNGGEVNPSTLIFKCRYTTSQVGPSVLHVSGLWLRKQSRRSLTTRVHISVASLPPVDKSVCVCEQINATFHYKALYVVKR